jgi:hypothetical protein
MGTVLTLVDIVDSCEVPDLQQWLLLQNSFISTGLTQQQRMKSQIDKKTHITCFAEGDSMHLKLHPYVQTSVAD